MEGLYQIKQSFGAISTLHLANDRYLRKCTWNGQCSWCTSHCQGYVFQLMAMRDSECTWGNIPFFVLGEFWLSYLRHVHECTWKLPEFLVIYESQKWWSTCHLPLYRPWLSHRWTTRDFLRHEDNLQSRSNQVHWDGNLEIMVNGDRIL